MGSGYILLSDVFQIYWSKHDPTNLYFSMGGNSDVNNPTEGLFIIAEIHPAQRYRRGTGVTTILLAPVAAPKPETLVVLPTYEVHQYTFKEGVNQTARDETPVEVIPDVTGLTTASLGLSGYEKFQYINDIILILNPTSLFLEKNSKLLYFMQEISGGSEPDLALWNFLLKLEVYDRAGRPPINMATFKPVVLLSDDETPEFVVSESDFFGLPLFWHPGAGFSQVFKFNSWLQQRKFLAKLNISRATRLIAWDKD